MLYVFNKILNKKNKITKEFIKILGLGSFSIKQICFILGINFKKNINELSVKKINKFILKIKQEPLLEHQLRDRIKTNILFFIKNGFYRGNRFKLNLPVNGQRTKTNRKTARKLNKY